jgi:hypothetical protein
MVAFIRAHEEAEMLRTRITVAEQKVIWLRRKIIEQMGRSSPVADEVRELRVKVAVAEEEFRGNQKELDEKTHLNDELHEQLRVSLGQEEGGWVERERELREKRRGRVNEFQRTVLSKHEWEQYRAAERRARLDDLQRDLGGKWGE